jgi:hypothetical protein
VLRLKPSGKVEVLNTGVVTPYGAIIYVKGYPAWTVAVVGLVIVDPEGAESAAKTSSIEKSIVWVDAELNPILPKLMLAPVAPAASAVPEADGVIRVVPR